MKKYFFLSFLLVASIKLFAQNSLPKMYMPGTNKKPKKDVMKWRSYLNTFSKNKADTVIYPMPVMGKIEDPVFTFNNGKGFDVYQSLLDSMYITKPDSTFQSNMPVARSYIVRP